MFYSLSFYVNLQKNSVEHIYLLAFQFFFILFGNEDDDADRETQPDRIV